MRIYLVLLIAFACVFSQAPALFAETAVGTAMDFYERGCKYMEEGNYEEAVNELNNAIDLDPEITDAYLQRGIAYLRLEKTIEAIDDLSLVLSRQPENFRASYWRGRARYKIEDFRGALVDVKAALQGSKDYLPALDLMGDIFFSLNDYQGALLAYSRAVKNSPGEFECLLKKIRVELILDMTDDAIADCDEILKANPTFFDAYYLRGKARKIKGDFEGALADVIKGLEYDPWKDNPEILFEKGLCLLLKGNFSAAIAEFRSAANTPTKEQHRYFIHLTLALLAANRRTEVKDMVPKILTIVPPEMTEADYAKLWAPIFRYIIGEMTEEGLVDHIVANIENAPLACLGYYAIAFSSMANGKKDRTLDALFKSSDFGTKEMAETIQARLLYKLVEQGTIECPPKILTENVQ